MWMCLRTSKRFVVINCVCAILVSIACHRQYSPLKKQIANFFAFFLLLPQDTGDRCIQHEVKTPRPIRMWGWVYIYVFIFRTGSCVKFGDTASQRVAQAQYTGSNSRVAKDCSTDQWSGHRAYHHGNVPRTRRRCWRWMCLDLPSSHVWTCLQTWCHRPPDRCTRPCLPSRSFWTHLRSKTSKEYNLLRGESVRGIYKAAATQWKNNYVAVVYVTECW